jgi:hypothetical protein
MIQDTSIVEHTITDDKASKKGKTFPVETVEALRLERG